MATADDSKKPGDGLWDVLSAYESLALLAHSESGGGDPVYSLLVYLNGHLRQVVDDLAKRGLVS